MGTASFAISPPSNAMEFCFGNAKKIQNEHSDTQTHTHTHSVEGAVGGCNHRVGWSAVPYMYLDICICICVSYYMYRTT